MTRDATTTSSRRPLGVVLIVALLAMGRACALDWSGFDDDLFLWRNALLNPPTFATFGPFVWRAFRGLWTPTTNALWWLVARGAYLDVADPGGARLNPWFFHATNVALHAINAALVFVLLRRLVRQPWAAAIGACAFAAHPVQVEAVAWACGTKDVLAATCSLASLVAIARPAPRRRHALACVAFAALAMTSKPSAAVLPALIAVIAWAIGCTSRTSRTSRATWAAGFGTLALAVPTLVVARVVQTVGDVPFVSLPARPIVALDALAMHAWHILWPLGRCVDYGLTPTALFASPRRWVTPLLPVGVAVAVAAFVALRGRRIDRAAIAGAAIFVVALAPNLGLAPFQFQVYSTVADRYAYVAMLGVGLIVAAIFDRLARRRVAIVVGAALVTLLAAITIARVGDWRNATTLWTRVLAVNPTSGLGHSNLGAAALNAGDLPAALAHLEIAAAGGPADGFALINLVAVDLRLGRPDAAADVAIRLVHVFRGRSDYDAELERRTVDRFAAAIARQDPAAAERLRATIR